MKMTEELIVSVAREVVGSDQNHLPATPTSR